jgi:hypothetical protein
MAKDKNKLHSLLTWQKFLKSVILTRKTTVIVAVTKHEHPKALFKGVQWHDKGIPVRFKTVSESHSLRGGKPSSPQKR